MHLTIWTLTLGLLLQLLATTSSTWNARIKVDGHEHGLTMNCHGSATQDETIYQINAQLVGHHCCAVGLALEQQMELPTMPNVRPINDLANWNNRYTKPDLPPPI